MARACLASASRPGPKNAAAVLDSGRTVTPELVRELADDLGHTGTARDLFERVALSEGFEEFLTLPAYVKLEG